MTQVSGYETWVVRIPYEEGRRFGTHVVLRLRTDDGLEGVGYVSNLTPWSVKAQHEALEALAQRVVGTNPIEVEATNAALLRTGTRPQFGGLARSVVSVIDTALWDLKAKMFGVPLHRLLGGRSALDAVRGSSSDAGSTRVESASGSLSDLHALASATPRSATSLPPDLPPALLRLVGEQKGIGGKCAAGQHVHFIDTAGPAACGKDRSP